MRADLRELELEQEIELTHNELGNLQGGDPESGEYYHVTEQIINDIADFGDVARDILENGLNTYHNNLTEIQGGAVDDDGNTIEAYHLSADELSTLQLLLQDAAEVSDAIDEIEDQGFIIDHNELHDVQGGARSNGRVIEAYHLTAAEFANAQDLLDDLTDSDINIVSIANDVIRNGTVIEHNNLHGVQGGLENEGDITEAYHLTASEHARVQEVLTDHPEGADIAQEILTNGVSIDHNALNAIQGGVTHCASIEAYHLTAEERSKVQELIAERTENELNYIDIARGVIDDGIIVNHNQLSGILGGAKDGAIVTEAYHLTEAELAKIQAVLSDRPEAAGIADDIISNGVIVEHNSMTGVQGGTTDNGDVTEAYHLTGAEHANVQELLDDYSDADIDLVNIANEVISNEVLGPYIRHNDLADIQGGAADGDGKTTEAYHLTDQELVQVQFFLAHYDELAALLSEEPS